MTQQGGLMCFYYEDSLETKEITNGKTAQEACFLFLFFFKAHISEVIVQ